MTYRLGVDVGTTSTAAAIGPREDRHAELVAAVLGYRTKVIPSAVFLHADGTWLVGETAERRAAVQPDRVARDLKRRIGDGVPVLVGGRPFAPHVLVGELLAWAVAEITDVLGSPPEPLLVTCPTTWGAHRRELLIQAARQVGLVREVRLLTEPVAAAIHYTTQERLDTGATVGVYDLGGGTFDATVLRRTEGGFELLGQPGGDEQLGGVNFDQAIMDHVAGTLGEHWERLDLTDPAVRSAVVQLRAHVVEAKEALSIDTETGIPVILPGVTREVRLTRAELEAMIRPDLERTVEVLGQTVAHAGLAPEELTAVLLVGGSSRIPLVTRLVAAEFGRPVAVDPETAIALGAAVASLPQSDEGATGSPPPAADVPTAIVTAATVSIIVPFVQALAGRLADDVYDKLRGLFRWRPTPIESDPRLRALFDRALTVERGQVIIHDPDTDTTLVVPDPLPDEAIKQLIRHGPMRIRGRVLFWDEAAQTWRPHQP